MTIDHILRYKIHTILGKDVIFIAIILLRKLKRILK